MRPLLQIRSLRKVFRNVGGRGLGGESMVVALNGVDLDVRAGECVAVVGESGCGKTTLARCAVRLLDPTAGSIHFDGEDLLALTARRLRARRRDFQIVFQDPVNSLNPRMTIGRAIAEPLAVHGVVPPAERGERVEELLALVGLSAEVANRLPHEFSAGQRQRVAIARALAPGPRLLVADEPVSALDLAVRAQIINLLSDLRSRLGLGLLFIAHDLRSVEHLADLTVVMFAGQLVEQAATARLFAQPQHPYTVNLLASVPGVGRSRNEERGDWELDPIEESGPGGEGCALATRCPSARERCRREAPGLEIGLAGHGVACHYPGELGTAEDVVGNIGTF